CGLNYAPRVEVALARAPGPQADRRSSLHIGRALIGLGDAEDRRDAQVVTGSRDANGDLAAIGNEEPMEKTAQAGRGGDRGACARDDAQAGGRARPSSMRSGIERRARLRRRRGWSSRFVSAHDDDGRGIVTPIAPLWRRRSVEGEGAWTT